MSVRERIDWVVIRLLSVLPAPLKRLIAGRPRTLDGLRLDLDTQLLLRLAELEPLISLDQQTPEGSRAELRKSVAAVAARRIDGVTVSDETIAGAAGALTARLYVPDEGPERDAPLVVYYHGGGWVAGDLDTHDQPCRLLARASGARVLSVDYRLAPEHPFPQPVEDALAAFRAAVAEAHRLGADPRRIAVAGDSAGGHLAAVTALQCAVEGGPAPVFQLLIYPVVDLVEVSQSRRTFAEGFLLEKDKMEWYEAHFAGSADRGDPRISPLYAQDLSGVAPAMVVTAGFDPLRDEGEAYARRMQDAGVPAILRRYPGYVHGFTHVLTIGRGARDALAEMGGVLRLALSQPAPAQVTDENAAGTVALESA